MAAGDVEIGTDGDGNQPLATGQLVVVWHWISPFYGGVSDVGVHSILVVYILMLEFCFVKQGFCRRRRHSSSGRTIYRGND